MTDKLINTALKFVGYLEKKSNEDLYDFTKNAGYNNYTMFAQTYRNLTGQNLQGQPWCAMFVSCVVYEAFGDKAKELLGGNYFAYCPAGVLQFTRMNAFYKTPERGDIVFFKDSKGVACHVGIVYGVDKNNIYTVEGNTSSEAGVIANGGAAAKKCYKKTYSKILGYGRMKMTKETKEITSVNDIVWELASRGIISDKALWLNKLETDQNAYWLAKKTVDYFRKAAV